MLNALNKCVGTCLMRGGAFIEQLGSRLQAAGWGSTVVFLKQRFINLYVKLGNRFSRRTRVQCPCCGWLGYEFLWVDCGTFTVPRVECPHCRAHERHRMLCLYLERRDPACHSLKGLALHFTSTIEYRYFNLHSADLCVVSTDYLFDEAQRSPAPAFQGDMQHLGLADCCCDLILCLHLLEHVPDDRQGIREIYRVLKPEGTAYVMVPFMMGWKKTIEFGAPDPDIYDHVRGYAPNDFEDRLAPFTFEKILPGAFLSQEEIQRYRIPPDSQVIFRCTKRRDG